MKGSMEVLQAKFKKIQRDLIFFSYYLQVITISRGGNHLATADLAQHTPIEKKPKKHQDFSLYMPTKRNFREIIP